MRLGAILLTGAILSTGGADAQPTTPAISHTGGRTVQEMQIVDGAPHALKLTSEVHQWPGVYFETRFSGRELTLNFADTYNRYRLYVDNRAPVIIDRPGNTPYAVKDLPRGWHTARLEKLSESQSDTGKFYGFTATAGHLAPLPVRARQIEFIGDSYTVGYGNTSLKRECTPEELRVTTDTQLAFGPMTAKHFNADYQINAFSGRGIVRNYDGFIGDPLPALYPYAVYDGKSVYRDPAWQPQIVVIALGGNDFSTPVHAGERWHTLEDLRADYIASYVTFVKDLRASHPNASFILADYGENEIASDIADVIKRLKDGGETRVTQFSVGKDFERTGCDWHLNTTDDNRITATLVEYVSVHPELWQRK